MNVIFYTIECPQCVILEKKLKGKNVSFEKVDDEQELVSKGFQGKTFPLLEVDGKLMEYKEAVAWINGI